MTTAAASPAAFAPPSDPELEGELEDQFDPEAGYILIWAVISMIALLLVGALAVDVGAFYVRSNELERSADAAALAGVVHMPGNLADATTAAEEVLSRNGIVHGGDISVTIEEGSSPRRLRVTIQDAGVETFLARLIRDSISIERTSEAEFAKPLQMGSPDNHLGSGILHPDFPGPQPPDYVQEQGFWLAVNGFCTAAEDGDSLVSAFDGNGESFACSSPPAEENPRYAGFHEYTVNVPDGRAADLYVDAFDPNYWPHDRPCVSSLGCNLGKYANGQPHWSGWPSGPTEAEWWQSRKGSRNAWRNRPIDRLSYNTNTYTGIITTNFQLLYPDTAGTPFDTSDDLPVGPPVSYTGGSDTYYSWPYPADYLSDFASQESLFNEWDNLFQIPTGAPSGDYTLKVWTDNTNPDSFGVNAFALRATYGPSWGSQYDDRCDSRMVGQELCPKVSGSSALSILAAAEGSTAFFKFAQIPVDYAGRSVRITLWDSDEGGDEISFHSPDRAPDQKWPFAWREANGPDTIFPNWTGAYELDVSGCGPSSPQPQPGPAGTRSGTCTFNDRLVEVNVDIPVDYAANDAGWWSIRYDFGTGTVTDRTTWTIDVIGDPVHLVEPG